MNKKTQSTFMKLFKTDVTDYVKQKGKFNYLSWAYAVQELKRVCPTARWGVTKAEDGSPFFVTECGYFVDVWVEVDGVSLSQIHPVLDNRNDPIEKPNAFQINTSLQRALAKAIALHGLGLYIFAGEDLPEADPLTEAQAYELNELASKIQDEDTRNTIYKAINEKQIDTGNFEACKERCNKIIKKEKTNG